jgi:hypothetical protein
MIIETLEDLARYIRTTLPRSVTLEDFRVEQPISAVRFIWEKKEFAVKKSLRVCEIKRQRLYVTAPSLLLQSLLMHAYRSAKVTEAVLEILREVENLVGPLRRPEIGLKLLSVVKKAIGKLSAQPIGTHSKDKAGRSLAYTGERTLPTPVINKMA